MRRSGRCASGSRKEGSRSGCFRPARSRPPCALRCVRRSGIVEREEKRGDRRVGGDRLVTQVETDPAGAWVTDHPCQEQGRRDEWQVGIPCQIAIVVKHRSSRRTFDTGEIELGVDRQGRRSTHHQARYGQPRFNSWSRSAIVLSRPVWAACRRCSSRCHGCGRRRHAARRQPGSAVVRSVHRARRPRHPVEFRSGPSRSRGRPVPAPARSPSAAEDTRAASG